MYERPANRFVAGFVGTPSMNFLEGQLVTEGEALHFELEGQRLTLSGSRRESLRGHVGRPLVLGIRPDALHPGTGDPARRLDLRLELIENLGDRWDVVLRLPSGATLISRTPPRPELEEGRPTPLGVDLDAAHWFEPGEAGVRVG